MRSSALLVASLLSMSVYANTDTIIHVSQPGDSQMNCDEINAEITAMENVMAEAKFTNQKKPQRKGKVQLINATDFHSPMRKSLGSKRKQIATEQIKTIAELFGSFEDNEQSKIFDNSDFGYQRITVERPLKLNFTVDEERLERLRDNKAFTKLEETEQQAITRALETLSGRGLYLNRDTFIKDMEKALKQSQVKAGAPLKKPPEYH